MRAVQNFVLDVQVYVVEDQVQKFLKARSRLGDGILRLVHWMFA